ncbi:oligomeric, coiled-coil, peripheral membrane protein [Chytriomyces hyalinus]|nr:oligomeric, coiled-coil, peripheral membrane protein [Chytriomyces hyalinus]
MSHHQTAQAQQRHLIAHVALNGDTVRIEAPNESENADENSEGFTMAISEATQIAPDSLIVLDQTGAVVVTWPRETTLRLFVFDHTALSQESEGEHVDLVQRMPRVALVPLAINSANSINALLSNCLDAFRSNYTYANSITSIAKEHVAAIEKLIRQQHVMAQALRVAVVSLQSHSKPTTDAFDLFMAHSQREMSRNNHLIQSFPADLQALHRIPIHPSISNSDEHKRLSDYIPEQRLLEWADKCRLAHEEFVRKSIQIADTVRNLKAGTEMEVNHDLDVDFEGLSNLLKSAQANLSTLQQTLNLLTRDYNRVQSILQDIKSRASQSSNSSSFSNMASSITSTFKDGIIPQQTLTALEGLQEIHQTEYIPALQSTDQNIRASLTATSTSYMHASSALRTRLHAISHLQSSIELTIAPSLLKLTNQKTSLIKAFGQLLHVHRMPAAWGAVIIEVVRRREFRRVFLARWELFVSCLGRLADLERKRRDGFEVEIGRYLPREDSSGSTPSASTANVNASTSTGIGVSKSKVIVKGLDDGIPKVDAKIVKGGDSLPNIGRNDVIEFELFIAQIRTAMNDVDPSSSIPSANLAMNSSYSSSARGGNPAADSISKLQATMTKMMPQMDTVSAEFDRLIARSGVCGDRIHKLEEDNARLKAELGQLRGTSMTRGGSGNGSIGLQTHSAPATNVAVSTSPSSLPVKMMGNRRVAGQEFDHSRAEETIKAYETRIKTLEDLLQKSYHMGSSRIMDASATAHAATPPNPSSATDLALLNSLQSENATLRTRLNLLESQFTTQSTTLQDTQTKLKEVASERNRMKEVVESERSLKSRCNELEREVSELKSQLQEKDREGRVVVGEVERCAGFVREVYELLDDCVGAFQIRSQVEHGGHQAEHGNSGMGYAGTSVDTATPGNLDRRYSSAASSLGKYHSPTSPSVGLMALVNAATSFSGGVAMLQARNHSSNSHSGGVGLGVNPVPVLVILSNLRTDEREIRRRLRELQDDIRCQALELAGLQDELAMAAAMGSDGAVGGGHLDGLLSGSTYEGASGHLSPNAANGMVFGSPSASSGPSHSAISGSAGGGGGAAIRSLTLPLIEELSTTKKEVHRLNAELEEATAAKTQAQKDIMTWSDKYDALQLELPEKDAAIQDLKGALARFEAEKTELFEANEEYSMKLKRVADAVSSLQSEKVALEEKLGGMAKQIQDLETKKLHAVTELATRHNEWTSTSNTLESKIHALQMRLEEQEATYKLKHAEHENEIAEWHKAAASHSTEHSNLQSKVSSLEREVSKGLLALRQKEADMESLEGVCEKLRIVLGREKGRITNLKEKVEDWSLVCKMAMECLTLRFDALGRVGDTLARLNTFISTFALVGIDGNDPSSLDAVDEDSPLRMKQLLHESYRRALQVSSSLSNSASNDGDLDSLGDAKMPILELRETYLHMIGLVDSIDVSGWADCVVESVHRWKELLVSQSLKKSMPSRVANKIAFSGFKIGDLALFLPTRNPKAWAAFNVNAPHYFLSISSAETLFSEQIRNRDWILGIITRIDRRQAPQRSKGSKAKTNPDVDSAAEIDANPFGLASGTSYFWCDVTPWNR